MELNKIYQIDCMEGLKQLKDNSVDLIITDPPYFFETHGRGLSAERKYLNTELPQIGVNNTFNYITKELLNELLRVCKETNIFIFCNKAQILDILLFAKKKELCFAILPFCKKTPTPLCNNQWLPDREWGIHLFKSCSVKGNYHTKRGFFIEGNYKNEDIGHPSVKPIHIMRRLILNLSNKGDLILDCFMGSGTTAVACKQLERNFIGFEILQKYVKISYERLSQQDLNHFK